MCIGQLKLNCLIFHGPYIAYAKLILNGDLAWFLNNQCCQILDRAFFNDLLSDARATIAGIVLF